MHPKLSPRTLALALVCAPAALHAAATGLGAGGPSLRLEPGQVATRAAPFTGNIYQPGGSGGPVVEKTSLFTGQPQYAVPLHVLRARDGIEFPIVVTFSGPTFPTVENDNERAPAGWIGTGWSLDIPYVAINHKGTRTYADDVIFCSLGPRGGGQVLREPETGRYYLATAPGIRIDVDTVDNPASPLFGQIKSWTFTLPGDGSRLVFGNADVDTVHDSERTLRHAGGMILASPYHGNASKPFIYRWDLRRVEDEPGVTGIDLEHKKFAETLWNGESYTRESYPSSATWRDRFGNEISRVEFELQPLESGEFMGWPVGAAKSTQRLFGTQRLAALSVFHEEERYVRIALEHEIVQMPHGMKGVLRAVTPAFGDDAIPGLGWSFSYRDSDLLLEKVTTPSGAVEEYVYEPIDLGGTAAQQEVYGSPFRRENGQPVFAFGSSNDWFVESGCDDRFCHEVLRYRKSGGRDTVYVRVTHNTGNYFDTGTVAFTRTLHASGTSYDEWQFLRNGNYFVIANTRQGTVEIREWDGRDFVRTDTLAGESGDPLRGSFAAKIDVTAMPGFLLVNRIESTRRLWVYLRDPLTGKWRNQTTGNRSDETCKLDNPPQGADDPRPNSTCFTWKWPVRVTAGESMFAVHTVDENLVYWFALNAAGDAFEPIGHLIPFLPGGIQETHGGNPVPQNWNHKIVDFRLFGEHLVVKSRIQNPTRSRYDIFQFDGAAIRRIVELGWERDHLDHAFNASNGTTHDRNLWFAGDYFIHANTHPSVYNRIEYWRRVQTADSVWFQLSDTLRTDIQHEGDQDTRIVASARHVSIEYYPSDSFRRGLQPDAYPVVVGGKYASWIYHIADDGSIVQLHDSLYTHAWPGGGCQTRLWNVTFAPTDNVFFGSTSRGDPPECHCTTACYAERYSVRANSAGPEAYSRRLLDDPVYSESYFLHNALSAGARLALWIRIVKFTGHPGMGYVYSRRYAFDGRGYHGAPAASVVRRFIRHAMPDAFHPPIVTEFMYITDPDSAVTAFNHNTLVPQFERVRTIRYGLPGGTEYSLHVDHRGHKLLFDSASLGGVVRATHLYDASGDTVSWSATQREPAYARGWFLHGGRDSAVQDSWPRGVAVNRIREVHSRTWGDNRSRRTAAARMHAYDDVLEVPLITVSEQGDRAAIRQIFLDDGRPFLEIGYDYPVLELPGESALRAHGLGQIRLPVDPSSGRYVTARAGIEHDPVFERKVARVIEWRDVGGSREDEELRKGVVPAFDPDDGLFVASEVVRRDSEGKPLETRRELAPGVYWYASVFYGGRAGLPVAEVRNARRENVAILTAGNGSVPQLAGIGPQGKLDADTAWNAGGAFFAAHQPRTGRYSIMVPPGGEPYTEIPLVDVHENGFGYVVSAWIRGEAVHPPVLRVSRHHGNGSAQNDTIATPVDGSYQQGAWQRWEIRLPNAWLVAQGMFGEGSGDNLRVSLPAEGTGNHFHVDAVVARPDDATFFLTAYDAAGRPTHSTDTHGQTVAHEYGIAGQPVATRDERGRVFAQEGANRVAENLEE